MKNILLVINFIMLSLRFFGQERVVGDSLLISFVSMNKNIADSNNLFLKIAYKNVSKKPIFVYCKLLDGYIGDRFCNVSLDLERLEEGKYVYRSTGTYHNDPNLEFADSLRHYDLPKVIAAPYEKDTLTMNLKQLGLGFERGSYRAKISLRVQTVINTATYSRDSTGLTAPPEDALKYITSDWIYFNVTKRIFESY
jgi:hypothetical protein